MGYKNFIDSTYDSMVGRLSRKQRATLNKLFVRPTLAGITFSEIESLLSACGAAKSNRGKTSGSRIGFMLTVGGKDYTFLLHKPHPGNEMRKYMVEQIAERFQAIRDDQPENGDIQ